MIASLSAQGFSSGDRPLTLMGSDRPSLTSLHAFQAQIRQEFTQGSAIHPTLYQAAVRVAQDVEISVGGEVSTPIHDALGWRFTRFGNQVKPTLYAALLENEDGSTWQAKLSLPRTDDRGKVQKYECPKGGGARAFLPEIPPEIRTLIAQRYGIAVPMSGSFWQWLAENPQIPIVLTEGGKKALSALSFGYVAVALFGCNGGYRSKDALGNPVTPYLIPDLERFAVPDRSIVLAFDQDEQEKTRRRVAIALARFGKLLTEPGCEVSVAAWQTTQGKGLDDLIVQAGVEAWEQAYRAALPLSQWQFTQRLEQKLTYPAQLQVKAGDLSNLSPVQLEQFPATGIVSIASAKGTGKTKLINLLIASSDKVLALSHRIALARNLGERLSLVYRGDADKIQGRFISEAGYTTRLVSVVDGLLSIDPAQFVDCDLILDEVTQEIRHHLTSSTCATDGKRPVILARFSALVRAAKRVIVADADLDNATLTYLAQLRGEDEKPYLLRNDFVPVPYDCRFLQVSDRSVITAEFLQEVACLPQGKVLFAATDSKATSKSLARILAQQQSDKRVLVLNSETSGGELERAFVANPDAELQHYDLIICSPSLATGVSIESQGVIQRVYGLFTGASSNDGDIAQSLSRVREPVERVVWVAKSGSNYSKVSRSPNPIEVRHHLKSLSSATVQLVRSSLRAESIAGLEHYDWQSDPHVSLYCHLAAEQNRSMRSLREAVLARLKFEGNRVVVEQQAVDPAVKRLLSQSRKENQLFEAEVLVKSESLSYLEVQHLEEKQSLGAVLSPEEQRAIAKFYLIEFYCLDELTIEDCLWDHDGRRRGELLNLEAQLYPGVAVERSAKSLEKQASWKQGYCPWDVSHTELRRKVREAIGLTELMERIRAGWQWSKYELQPYADKARAMAAEVKVALHFTISEKVSDAQVVHQLLSQMGIVLRFQWTRSHPGHEGKKLRVYSLEPEHWQQVRAVLARREAKRQQIAQQQAASAGIDGSSPELESIKWAGDPSALGLEEWFTEEGLAEVWQMWRSAQGNLELLAEMRLLIPEPVLKHLGLMP